MTMVLEVDEQGALRVPPEALGDAKPHTRFVLEKQGEAIMLTRGETGKSRFSEGTPEERVQAFLRWANRKRPPALPIPLESLRRENLYE